MLMRLVLELGTGQTPPATRWVWFAGIVAIVVLRLWPRRGRRPARVAGIGLMLGSVYIGTALIGHAAAASWVRVELDRRGISEVRDLMVGPSPANPLGWNVVVDIETAYRYGTFRWLPRPALSLADRRLEKPPPSPVIEAALAAPEIQGALNWMRFPYVEVESTNRGHTVHVLDVRYVRRRTAGFGTATVELDSELRVLSAE